MLDTLSINVIADLSHSLAAPSHSLANSLMAMDFSSLDLSSYAEPWQNSWQHSWQHTSELIAQLSKDGQQFQGDVLGDMGKGWRKFVESGQIWAMIIGAIAGYLFRSVTSM
ncbi:MAG: hypothetical protein WCO45_10165 [Pseudanabaena sp. ELA607]|jgi:hypothetical protein